MQAGLSVAESPKGDERDPAARRDRRRCAQLSVGGVSRIESATTLCPVQLSPVLRKPLSISRPAARIAPSTHVARNDDCEAHENGIARATRDQRTTTPLVSCTCGDSALHIGSESISGGTRRNL